MTNTSLFQIINPYNQKMIDSVPFDSELIIKNKIEKLNLSSEKKTVKNLKERVMVVKKLAEIISEKKMQFATQITQEMGKCLTDSLLEIERAELTIESYVSYAQTLEGKSYNPHAFLNSKQLASSKFLFYQHIPYGKVLAITPFNFPINLALHKLIPSYLMGNATILKPNPQTYLSSKMLVDAAYEAQMDESELALLLPDVDLLEKLISSNEIDLISFTGGMQTALKISNKAGIKKTIYELGGNDALVILKDADLNEAAKTLIAHRFRVSGQRCTSAKKIFVHQEIEKKFIEEVISLMKSMKVGDPMELTTDIGPLVNKNATELINKRVQHALKNGALMHYKYPDHHYTFGPCLMGKVHLDMELVKEESFGPVAPIFTFNHSEEVIHAINNSRMGLQCGVFTNNLIEAKEFAHQLINVGAVNINEGPALRFDQMPFGGSKESGHGREGGAHGLMEYGMTKVILM